MPGHQWLHIRGGRVATGFDVDGSVAREPRLRCDRCAVGAAGPDFEVEVRTSRVSGHTNVGDVLASGHGLADRHVDPVGVHVGVTGSDGSAADVVLDQNQVPVTAGSTREHDAPVGSGEDVGSGRCRKVNARMEASSPRSLGGRGFRSHSS